MKKLIKFISTEEFRKILKAEKDNSRKLAYVLAFGSGLRISEVVGLREQISPCCNCELKDLISIDEDTKKRIKKKECIKCGKLWNSTECPRSKTVWKIKPIEAHQINLETKQIRILGKGGKERITVINPMFPIKENMLKLLPLKIERRTLQNRFKNLCIKTLSKPLNFHTLRHGFANHMLNERGLPMPMVQGFGGWARLDTVGIYAKANPLQAIDKVWEGF